MSDTTPETPVEPTPSERAADDIDALPEEPSAAPVEPTNAGEAMAAADAEPVDLVEPTSEAPTAEPVIVENENENEVVHVSAETPVVTEVITEPQPAPSVVTPPQTVYVHAPVPPQKKGNRGIGSLIALVSAIIFAALYAAVVLVVVPLFAPPRAVGFEFLNFVTSSTFFVSVGVFAVAFILLVLILNRAGWWAYIIGSLIVGLVVYFGSIGVLLVLNGSIGSTVSEGVKIFRSALQSPVTVIAGLVAREVALWMGALIAARGRKVKVRNVEARAAYDRDTARARADYERAVAANAAQ